MQYSFQDNMLYLSSDVSYGKFIINITEVSYESLIAKSAHAHFHTVNRQDKKIKKTYYIYIVLLTSLISGIDTCVIQHYKTNKYTT